MTEAPTFMEMNQKAFENLKKHLADYSVALDFNTEWLSAVLWSYEMRLIQSVVPNASTYLDDPQEIQKKDGISKFSLERYFMKSTLKLFRVIPATSILIAFLLSL